MHFERVGVLLNVTIFDSLLHRNPKREFEPGIATSWKGLSDTQWEFKIGKGVHFHNGGVLTPEDVKFSVASAPGAASVRVWETMSRGRGPRGGRPVPEGVHVVYPLTPPAIHINEDGTYQGMAATGANTTGRIYSDGWHGVIPIDYLGRNGDAIRRGWKGRAHIYSG